MAALLLAAWKGPEEWNGGNTINDESIYYSTYTNTQGQWAVDILKKVGAR